MEARESRQGLRRSGAPSQMEQAEQPERAEKDQLGSEAADASHLHPRSPPAAIAPPVAAKVPEGVPAPEAKQHLAGGSATAASSRGIAEMAETGSHPAEPSQGSRTMRSGMSAGAMQPLQSQQTPLDLDAEALLTRSSRSRPLRLEDEDGRMGSPRPGRGKRQKLSESPSPSRLRGQALLQWLWKRRLDRGVDTGKVGEVSGGADVESVARPIRNAKQLLQEQLKQFKLLLENRESPETEFGLSAAPPVVTTRPYRKNQKAPLEGGTVLLPPTCLQVDAVLGAEATDAWDKVQRKVLLEAKRAERRSAQAAKAPSGVPGPSFLLPWRSLEVSLEASLFQKAHLQLQKRCDLEPGRRVLMRQLGGQPTAGLFEDPAAGSAMASVALNAALVGFLPAESTGNEFQAATLLPSRRSGSLAELVEAARPGLLGSWHPCPALAVPTGCKDALLCTRLFRDTCAGLTSTFAGRMAREGLTEDQPLAPSGGQEHCFCNVCSEWLSRSSSKSHQCSSQSHVGKPQATEAKPKPRLKIFHQSWDGLEVRLSFQHTRQTVEISCDAVLENAFKRLLWPQVWEPKQVSSSWRLTKPQSQPCQSSPTPNLSLRVPYEDFTQPGRFLLSSSQLALLGWMRQQERQSVFKSQQTIRQGLCETDLALELQLTREFESSGGLILTRAPNEEPYFDRAVATCVLALMEDAETAKPSPMLSKRRCRLEATATLILVQQQSLPYWQQALEAAPMSRRRVVIIGNQRKMRSLTVAEVVEADLILVSVQLFSSEAYQRHFDSLSKPGLQVWDASSLQKRIDTVQGQGDAEPEELCQDVEGSFEQGDLVTIHGLIAKAHLNGRRGQLIGWQEDTGRWSCLLEASKSAKVPKSTAKRKRSTPESGQLINVRPCNLRALRPGVRKASPRKRLLETPLKVSKYYSELRSREDYMARRQVELERHTFRLVHQAVSTGLSKANEEPLANTEEAAPEVMEKVQFPLLASSASEVTGSPALLEMFRFKRLVIDDCHLVARPLGQLVSSRSSHSGGLSQYLGKVAPLYAVHAIEAHARWGIAPLTSVTCDEGVSEDVAPMASLLGIQIPWCDRLEANRFLQSHAAAAEEVDPSDEPRRKAPERRDTGGPGVSEETHLVHFSVGERLVYSFRCLEQRLAAKYRAQPKIRKVVVTDEQARVLLQLCTYADEATAGSLSKDAQDYGAEVAQLLLENVVSHWKSKSADAVLADAQQNDFELRLKAFKTLGTSVEGYEREVLLACAHSGTEQLKLLLEASGEEPPVEARLRRLAQAAVEGEFSAKVPRNPRTRTRSAAPGDPSDPEACSEVATLHRPTRHGCGFCNQITDEGRETLARLRLASGRAVAAERRAAQRVRVAGALAAASGLQLRPAVPVELRSDKVCLCCKEDGGKLLLFPCGHTAHAACLGRINGRCPDCQLDLEEDEAVVLDALPSMTGKRLCRFSSKIAAVASELKRIVSRDEGKGTAQCVLVCQWSSALAQLEAAITEEGMTPLVQRAESTDTGEDADKRIILLAPDFVQNLGKASVQAIWRERLLAPCSVRHVLIMNVVHSPAKRHEWERKILGLARMESSVGILPAVVLHRFVVHGTVEEDLVTSQT
ncbi:fhkA [Symbiodinium sp. CCMP2456]|nr:fhkA [Symbiodinium sp. CCMP2456]